MNKKRDCFATLAMTCEKYRKSISLKWLCHLAMTWRGKRSFAFTLSEVLIVLAVLGVVAAMTIPDLIQDYREKALITALKKNYSIFEQAIEMAQVDNGFITGWDIGIAGSSDGALKLYNILKPYLRIEKECGTATKQSCFAERYKTTFGDSSFTSLDYTRLYAKGVLASGASFGIYSSGTGCNSTGSTSCGHIFMDINGKTGPNKSGVDYFVFYIFTDKSNGLTPAGYYRGSGLCEYRNEDPGNGVGCTWWVLTHGNMDYLRKDGKYTY